MGEGPVKQRLSRAFADHLEDLQDGELPPPLRGEFEELHAALHRIAPVGNETRVRASVQKMSPQEAGGHAGTIVRLYVELLGDGERAEPLKVVSNDKTPRYLTRP